MTGDSVEAEESYEYDDNGNLVKKITPKGETLVYVYDAHNRLERKYRDDDGDGPDEQLRGVGHRLHGHGPACDRQAW